MHSATMTFDTGVSSHVGLVRGRNEDNFLVRPEIGVWAVADGMGGHEGGRFASDTIVETLNSIGNPVSAPDLLARFEDRVNRANDLLQDAIRKRGAMMGATVAALLVHGSNFACLWSGDSRIYLIRAGTIDQLTRDHTEAQELVDRGVLTRQEAKNWPGQNVVTRAIGVREEADMELEHGKIEPNDSFVICSDGLTGHVEDQEILQVVEQPGAAQGACDRLVQLTLTRGGSDNVTVVVVRCRPAERTLVIPRGVNGSLRP